LQGVAVVSAVEAKTWGFTGVRARGSGINYDLRRERPYESYTELVFNIPVGAHGDCYDRYFLRREERRQSLGIIQQILNRRPQGPVKSSSEALTPPGRTQIKKSRLALIHHFNFFSTGPVVAAGETYTAVEAPKGEFGIYLISDGSSKPYRCKVKSPGFLHLQGLDFRTRGHLIADVVTALGSQDIVFGEVDR